MRAAPLRTKIKIKKKKSRFFFPLEIPRNNNNNNDKLNRGAVNGSGRTGWNARRRRRRSTTAGAARRSFYATDDENPSRAGESAAAAAAVCYYDDAVARPAFDGPVPLARTDGPWRRRRIARASDRQLYAGTVHRRGTLRPRPETLAPTTAGGRRRHSF